MAIAGDLKVSATLDSYRIHPLWRTPPSSSKVKSSSFQVRGPNPFNSIPRSPLVALESQVTRGPIKLPSGIVSEFKLSSNSFTQEAETFLLNAINMNFLERLNLVWKIIFPSRATRRISNANIAKQRLKMILFSERCAVNEEAKQKIVTNVVHALSDFVEIESQDKVQLTVSTDTDLGTVYSVTVPVRRVKPDYQDSEQIGSITNIEYLDNGERSGTVDVRFGFFVPDDNNPPF
ncbi:hypothetical protein SAY86_018798 [Trapa natans]|uniref:Plastid division regulator MinE n=1 Tax=Trapa natans TaxID=22666 RepID=A0AAN7R159_TRANT|nr:hypothetical protein SAY86_018798 [Trapa natans]